MSKVQVYSVKGVKTGQVDLPKSFDAKINQSLITQAIHVYEDRNHKGYAKVQTRSLVSVTKAKMYKQKGTGNARHGSRNAPIFSGGGVAHGPKGVKRTLELPRKVARKALLSAINLKVKSGKVIVAEKLDGISKTKDAQIFLKGVMSDITGNVRETLVAVTGKNKDMARNFRNIQGVVVKNFNDLNAYNVYFANLLVLDKEAFNEGKEVSKKEAVIKEVKASDVAKPAKKTAVKKETVKKVTKAKPAKAKKVNK